MNNRRNLLITLSAALFAPRAVFAQAKKPPIVIGWLSVNTRGVGANGFAAFKDELATLGWKEGAQCLIDERWADSGAEGLQSAVEALAARRPAIVLTSPAAATIAAAKSMPSTPVVQTWGNSPVNLGLAASLARPGGMVTGLTNIPTELSEKFLELLLAAAPKLKRIGFLFDPASPAYDAHIKNAHKAAGHYRVDARFAEASDANQLDGVITHLAKEGVQGLVVMSSAWFQIERQRIVKLALTRRWPVISSLASFAESGALLSYGADILALHRRAAHYVDRILRGTKPGDLPIEQPMTFELVVNMKTAKLLGLTMPPEIMVQATRVIQ